jgi:outer membrane lipoprotein-sorting protein
MKVQSSLLLSFKKEQAFFSEDKVTAQVPSPWWGGPGWGVSLAIGHSDERPSFVAQKGHCFADSLRGTNPHPGPPHKGEGEAGALQQKKQKAFIFCAALMLSGCMAGGAPRLTVQDADDVRHVQDYLNHTQTFSARFVQSGAYGPGAGLVWLDRPGTLRIDYAGPGARLMVISGGRVRVLDRRTGALTTMALSRTPLGILLAPTIDLFGPVTVTSVQHVGNELELTMQKTGQAGQGNLTLYLSQMPMQLQAVTVTDAYQHSSTLTLSDINMAPALTPDLFAPPAGPAGS